MNNTESLANLFQNHEISISQEKLSQLLKYKKLLLEWTEMTNLISKNTICDFDTIHLLDSILPLKWLNTSGPLIDLGTGGGLPGIAIKIIYPEIPVTLSETKSKKIKFLQSCTNSLNLKGIDIINPAQEKPEKKYSILVSRAFGTLQKITREAKRYLTPDGCIFAYKGLKETAEGEIKTVNSKWNAAIKEYNYQINNEKTNRTVVILEKKGNKNG